MTYIISKKFAFSAAHVLNGLPEGHPCGRLHGHNYEIEVELSGESLNEVGFVRDYGDLKPIGAFIDSSFDHRSLNDAMPVQPSAENIARFLFDHFKPDFPELSAISVCETPKTKATYRP